MLTDEQSKDAERWHWIANYILSDNPILHIQSKTVDDLTAAVDAAMAAQEGGA